MKRRPPKRDPDTLTDLRDLRVGLYVRVSLADDEDKRKAKLQQDLKKLVAKQTEDQKNVGLDWAKRVGANVVDIYSDPDISASRFTDKVRPEFERLLGDIADGKLDAVWFWELSRSSRRLDVFAKLRNLCRDMGVLWVIKDRVYDPDAYMDMLAPTIMAAMDEVSSEQSSERVQRGKKSSARTGRRAGKVPYGYRADYDRDGKYLRDEPDLFDGNGRPVEDSPAAVVREIFARVLGGYSLVGIARDLNERGIRTKGDKNNPAGYPWDKFKIRYIALSPTYLGKRVFQVGDGIPQSDRVKMVLDGVETKWPPLVDAETFWAVHRLLSDPSRHTGGSRPGRKSTTLLSSLARCAECGGKLIRKNATERRPAAGMSYFCNDRSCVGIRRDMLDDYVEKIIVRWLSDPDVVADLTRAEDSAAAVQARGDLEQLRAELAGLYRDAKAGRVSPVIATATEKGLQERIDDAEQRIQAATLPPVLRGNIGPQAEAGWKQLDLEVKRAIIRAVADIRVRTVGHGSPQGGGPVPARDRVEWRWLIGPDAQPAETVVLGGGKDALRQAQQQRQDTAVELRRQGLTYEQIAQEVGVSTTTVWTWLKRLGLTEAQPAEGGSRT
jgi:site-specific DNA recombinase